MEHTVMEALTPYLVMILGVVLFPSAGYLIRTAVNVKSRLDIHEASDALVFKQLAEKLHDLKQDSESQNAKLDDIRERLPRRKTVQK